MGDEAVKAKDEVQLVLYDKDGKVKQTSSSKKPISKLERYIIILKKVIDKW